MEFIMQGFGLWNSFRLKTGLWDSFTLINKKNYTATLAYKIFRALIVITTVFRYETKQINAVNIFLDIDLDKLIYYYFPYGFEQSQKCLRLKKLSIN
jgi:hypothetical protein